MRQQYAVEVNNIFECLEHEVTEQEYEKNRVDILWTNIKEGIQKAAHSRLPKIVKKNKKPWISTDILDMMEKRNRAKNTQSYDEIIYLFIYLLNIFKQGRTYRRNHCFTMLPCTM